MADLHSRNDSGAPAGEKKRSLKLEYVDQLRTEIDTLQQDLAEARKLSDSHAKIVEENRLLRLALEQEKFRRLSCEKQADWMRQQISEMSAEMRVVVEHVAAEWKASLFAAAHPASSHNSASQDRHEYTEQTGRRSLITWSADEAESSANFSSSPSSPLTKEMAMRIFARETEHRMHTLDQLSKARKHAGEAWLLPGGGEPDTMNSRVANIDMKEAAGQIKMDAGLLETKSHRAHQDDQMSRNSESCSELSSEEDEEPSSPWRNPTDQSSRRFSQKKVPTLKLDAVKMDAGDSENQWEQSKQSLFPSFSLFGGSWLPGRKESGSGKEKVAIRPTFTLWGNSWKTPGNRIRQDGAQYKSTGPWLSAEEAATRESPPLKTLAHMQETLQKAPEARQLGADHEVHTNASKETQETRACPDEEGASEDIGITAWSKNTSSKLTAAELRMPRTADEAWKLHRMQSEALVLSRSASLSATDDDKDGTNISSLPNALPPPRDPSESGGAVTLQAAYADGGERGDEIVGVEEDSERTAQKDTDGDRGSPIHIPPFVSPP